jgi:membrane protease YdiL (CAAX protease family)
MLALFLLILVPVIMWGGQSILLLAAGMPIRARISSASLPRRFQSLNRAITHAAFAAVLLAYPAIRGESPVRYYLGFFPLAGRYEFLHGLCVSVLYLAALYLGWVATDNVRFEIRHRTARIVRRLSVAPISAVFGALVEELLFRALLLAGLLESFSTPIAVVIGAIVFAVAHYIRQVKRYWTFAGHIGLGLLLCVAFVCTRSLWLPMGLHAGGILLIMSLRPFLRYTGPRWLVGVSIFPYAGLTGIVALVLLTLNIWLSYGGS